MDKVEEQILKDINILKIINHINEKDIVFFENKRDCIEYLINLYIDYIYEEFFDYIKLRENIDISLYDYVDSQYFENYFELNDIYVVDPYEYCDILDIEKLFEISKSNNFHDLIDFCEKYKDIVEKNF